MSHWCSGCKQQKHAEGHGQAGVHHQDAAKHLEDAAKHHEAGNDAKGALSAMQAYGHHSPASNHQRGQPKHRALVTTPH